LTKETIVLPLGCLQGGTTLQSDCRPISGRKFVTLSVGPPLCPYDIAYRRGFPRQSVGGGGSSWQPILAHLTFENCCPAERIDFWQPLPRLWRGWIIRFRVTREICLQPAVWVVQTCTKLGEIHFHGGCSTAGSCTFGFRVSGWKLKVSWDSSPAPGRPCQTQITREHRHARPLTPPPPASSPACTIHRALAPLTPNTVSYYNTPPPASLPRGATIFRTTWLYNGVPSPPGGCTEPGGLSTPSYNHIFKQSLLKPRVFLRAIQSEETCIPDM